MRDRELDGYGGEMDAGERWDAYYVDHIEALAQARLPGNLATQTWHSIAPSKRLRLTQVIDKMPDKWSMEAGEL